MNSKSNVKNVFPSGVTPLFRLSVSKSGTVRWTDPGHFLLFVLSGKISLGMSNPFPEPETGQVILFSSPDHFSISSSHKSIAYLYRFYGKPDHPVKKMNRPGGCLPSFYQQIPASMKFLLSIFESVELLDPTVTEEIKDILHELSTSFLRQSIEIFFRQVCGYQIRNVSFEKLFETPVNSIRQLAGMLNVSPSTVNTKFHDYLNISSREFVMKLKAHNILNDLKEGRLSLSEIRTKYEYHSATAFNTFCKKQFGNTPGKIRPRKIIFNKHKTPGRTPAGND